MAGAVKARKAWNDWIRLIYSNVETAWTEKVRDTGQFAPKFVKRLN